MNAFRRILGVDLRIKLISCLSHFSQYGFSDQHSIPGLVFMAFGKWNHIFIQINHDRAFESNVLSFALIRAAALFK